MGVQSSAILQMDLLLHTYQDLSNTYPYIYGVPYGLLERTHNVAQFIAIFYICIVVLWTNIIYGVGCFIATVPLYATVHFQVQQFAIGIEFLITCLKVTI